MTCDLQDSSLKVYVTRHNSLCCQVEREAESTTRMRSEMVRLQEQLEEKEGELEGMATHMEDAVAKLSDDLGAKGEKVR